MWSSMLFPSLFCCPDIENPMEDYKTWRWRKNMERGPRFLDDSMRQATQTRPSSTDPHGQNINFSWAKTPRSTGCFLINDLPWFMLLLSKVTWSHWWPFLSCRPWTSFPRCWESFLLCELISVATWGSHWCWPISSVPINEILPSSTFFAFAFFFFTLYHSYWQCTHRFQYYSPNPEFPPLFQMSAIVPGCLHASSVV